jgi:hypothetical protein
MSAVPICYSIALTPNGEGQTTVNLGSTTITLVTKYNYSAQCWCMDIYDVNANLMLAGIMLVPGVNLLAPYAAAAAIIGGLVLAETNPGDYQSPDLLGINTTLLWFPVGATVLIPVPSGGW